MSFNKDDFVKDSTQHYEHAHIDYARNVNARIVNPLAGLTKSELRSQVSAFCDQYGFQQKEDVFMRGALAAQNPDAYDDIAELTEADKTHLKREVTHKWHLPKALYYSIALCSLGSAVQGWDNTGANGANLSFPQEFGIENNTWLIGFINVAPSLFGLLSAWAADPINNAIGRRGAIFVTGLFCVFPVLGQAFTHNWYELLICRALMGLGMGIKISTIPIFSAEVAPASVRGGMVTSFQLAVAFGIVVGFLNNLIWYRIGPLAWRFQLAAAFIPAIPILLLVWFCPESPRWLLKKHRYQESFASFCRLRNSEFQAARDLFYAHRQVAEEREAFAGVSLAKRIKELFTIPRIRRGTVASAWIVISQQFSGISVISYYSSGIFQDAGYSTLDSLLASLGYGLIVFIFAFVAVFTMDSFGRRNMLLSTFPAMALCLLATGLCFLMPSSSSAKVPLIAVFVYIFSALYGSGIGPMPSIYFSEAFPLSHREIGAAMTICVNNAVGSALSLTWPSMLARIGPTGSFGFYAGLNFLAFIVIFLIVPETKQRTLEELDYIFSVPTRRHVAYQVRQWLSWAVKRHILFQKNAQLESLYKEPNLGQVTEDLRDV